MLFTVDSARLMTGRIGGFQRVVLDVAVQVE
jgi:hypothetical protein